MNKFQQKIAIIFVQNFKFFIILTIIIIFGLGYFLFVKQFYSELNEKRKELENFKQDGLITKKKQLDNLKILKEEYQKLEGLEVQKLLVILPDKKNIPDLFEQIEDITKKSGVTLLSLDVTEGGAMDVSNANENKATEISEKTEKEISLTKNKSLKALNISAEIGGVDYFTLKVFLNNLEKNIRLIDVISFDFCLNEKSQKINLRTYYLE